jgi:choline dehydrogenase-like flavoprotein
MGVPENIQFELCIIGAGPAGMILAMEYAKLNPDKHILLLDFGYKNQSIKNSLDESIIINNPINHYGPYYCTNKGLGGTSATWGGRCVMYDEVDFLSRPILNEGCTWNKSLFDDLSSFISNAAAYFECGDADFILAKNNPLWKSSIAEGFKDGPFTDKKVEKWSMPTRFGTRYEKEIREAKNITFLEGFEARNFSVSSTNNTVEFLQVSSVLDSQTKNIYAKTFVIAAGAQESTRLLLRNKQLFAGNEYIDNSLGKYYQSHVSGKIASVQFNGNPYKTNYGFLRDANGVYLRRRFQMKTDAIVEHNLLNAAIWLDNPIYANPSHKNGAMSLMYLIMLVPFLGKRLAPPAISDSITKGGARKINQHIWNVLKDFPSSVSITISIFIKRYLLGRKLPGVFLFNKKNTYSLHFHAEQQPLVENRMELGDDNETLKIFYKISDNDIDSVIKTHELLDQWIQQIGCGKLTYYYPKNELKNEILKMSKDGIHQSGTTRIASTNKDGVVDENLQVFGLDNLFICSSSVFPISGQANPTFFLGTFAVRLAHHLTSQFKS